MAVNIIKVTTKKQLKQFIRFNCELYKGNPYFVPDLYEDMIGTLRKDRNAAFEFCEADYFLAMQEDKIVGRVAAIINHRANEKWNRKAVRFGWIDFVDDAEVSEALLATVEKWGKERGMTEIQGPLGFTDFDPEGMLVEGFDRVSTMATIYNYPYYPQHMEHHGYTKDVDWIEFLFKVPKQNWEKAERLSAIIARRNKLHAVECTSRSHLAKKYGKALFELVNECYSPLYGFSPLSDAQIAQFIKMYLPLIDLRLVSLIADEEENLVGIGVSLTSFAEALQKSGGRLFPFGWIHFIKPLLNKHPKRLDFLLMAIKPEYQGKGVNAMIINDLLPRYIEMGVADIESNPELELNEKIQSQWDAFEKEQHKRRRAYKKEL
ncbi:MAG: N-acetyltransferase [Bacteroidaceae bacterium]|nr:N-acetyltransferase [Bacteroidaceae bacterium]MBQ3538736.1 N-acetyltransferase [Bacteroidaceae bacterium]MBQ6694698.1 N-acetyltransferase [Bacteroidaceae bacterium]